MKMRCPLALIVMTTVAGCQTATSPAPAAKPAPVAMAPESDTDDRARIAFALMDAPFAKIKFEASAPIKVVVDFRVGKDVVYKDWFVAGKGFVEGNAVVLALRPVDNGELSKARRIRYAISCGGLTATHLVKNPFLSLQSSGTVSGQEAKLGDKPIPVFSFQKPDLKGEVGNEAQSQVRVAVYKATPQDLQAAGPLVINHVEGVVAPATKGKKKKG